MEWITRPEAWVALLTLTVLEIVLGIDNIVFIPILAGKLPHDQQARACFCVGEMGRLLPARTALNMSVEYASVVVFGYAVIVSDPAEARRGLQLLLDKYFAHLKPGEDYRPITGDELALTTVYRIDIESWNGKRKQVEPDFPGAFFYSAGATG